MKDYAKNFERLLHGFTKPEFDTLVKAIIQQDWGVKDVVVVDGTGDGGIDIKIFRNHFNQKIQFQLTIQESNIQDKIKRDVIKAARNVINFNYTSQIFFFYSLTISPIVIDELEEWSRKNHNLELKIYDARLIASKLDRDQILKSVFFEIIGDIGTKEVSLLFNKEDQMMFDLISFGKEPVAIKHQIIGCYILHRLDISDNDKFNMDSIKEMCNKHFSTNSNLDFYQRVLDDLKLSGKIVFKGDFIFLSPIEKERIKNVRSAFEALEKSLIHEVRTILTRYNKQKYVKEVIDHLSHIYTQSYSIDYAEIESISDRQDINLPNIYKAFLDFIKQKVSQKDFILIAKDLIEVCRMNDFIQRVCAGKLFAELVNPEHFNLYLNQKERQIYIDTQVGIYLLLQILWPEIITKNPFSRVVRELLGYVNSEPNCKLFISSEYVSEVAYHLKESFMLAPFISYEFFKGLGPSNNVIINFYLENIRESPFEVDFLEFMDASGFEDLQLKENELLDYCISKVEEIFTGYVTIKRIYDNDKVSRAEEILRGCYRNVRSPLAVYNDALMLTYLSDRESQVYDPIFTTWDYSFFPARSKFISFYTSSNYWHLFTPGKLLDHLSLLRFSINSESITNDILAVVENDFNLEKKAFSLLDSVSKLLNLKSEVGRNYINDLRRFRQDEIYLFDEGSEQQKENYKPIDKIILDLSMHYNTKATIDNLKVVFDSSEVYSEVINLFEESIKYYLRNSRSSPELFTKMDMLISKVVKTESPDLFN